MIAILILSNNMSQMKPRTRRSKLDAHGPISLYVILEVQSTGEASSRTVRFCGYDLQQR